MSRSIGLRILLIASFIVTVSFSIFTITFEGHGRALIIDRVSDSLSETARVTAESIGRWMQARSHLSEALANNIASTGDTQAFDQINRLMSRQPYSRTFMTTFMGTEQKDLISIPPNDLPPTFDPRIRKWYIDTKFINAPTISEPYIDLITGKMVVSVVAPITINGKFSGVAGGDIELTDIIKTIKQIDLGDLGYAFLVNAQGKVLIHHNQENTLQNISKVFPGAELNLNSSLIDFSRSNQKHIFAFFPVPYLPATEWKLGIVVDREKVFQPIVDFRQTAAFAALATVAVIIILLGISIRQRVTKPLDRMTRAMTQLAEGDLNTEIPESSSNDEIGAMRSAMQVFKANALTMEKLRQDQIKAKSQSEHEKKLALQDAATRFENSIVRIVELLSVASSTLNSSATDMSINADTSATLAADSADYSDAASNNMTTIASATEELSVAIAEISRQTEIASQVSADCIKTLNNAKSSNPNCTSELGEVLNHVERLHGIIGILAAAISQQSSATDEITHNVHQASLRAAEVANTILGVREIAAETDKAALYINTAAADLAVQTDFLQIEVANFLRTIRKPDTPDDA